jgi:hypothetical protein
MGLTSFIAIKNDGNEEYELSLDHNIVQLFENCYNFFEPRESKTSLTFNGKEFYKIILTVANVSLYKDLNPNQLQFIYFKLSTYLEEHKFLLQLLEQKCNDHSYELQEDDSVFHFPDQLERWLEVITQDDFFYMPTYSQLCQLRDVFKICADNNLYLYASS